jgi:hypothetical protein
LGKNLSAVPTALTLKDTVEGAPVAVQGPVVVSNDAPMVASVPKEPEDGLLLNVVPAPLSVAVGKGNVESSSLSDNDSSNSGSEESEESEESDSGSDSGSGSDGSDSSSTTSNCGSHTEKPVKPSFPTGVGTAVVSTAELVDAASAASVAAAKVLGPELPSASLFEGPPEDTLLETYGPGKPEEADDEATDEGVMDVTNAIYEEENDDVDEEQEDVDGTEEEEEQEGADGGDEEEEQEGANGAEEEEEVDYGEEEEEQAVDGMEAEEEQAVHGTEVEDAAMVIQAFGVISLIGLGKFLCVFVCILV